MTTYDTDRRLTFQEVRAVNSRRGQMFGHDEWNPAEWGNALAGETGELCNLLKKYIRQSPGDPLPEDLIPDIKKEVADVFLYLDLLCDHLEISLADAVINKFNEVSVKRGLPQHLCHYPGCPNRCQQPPCALCYE